MKKVLGMGNALVDILLKLDNDELLDKFGLPKGSMQLVDEAKSDEIIAKTNDVPSEIASGGSAANTINGLAHLGVHSGYIGKIGKDEFGELFKSDLEKKHIDTKLLYGEHKSGRAVAFISKDSERTFATYLGAAVDLNANDISAGQFEGYDYFHIEGYLVLNHDLVKKAMQSAKEAGLKVSIDMASFNVVEDNLEFLRELIDQYVDIVFANEEEAKSLTGKDPEEALHEIAEMSEIAVVKVGARGALIKSDGIVSQVEAIKAKPIDTTGAGDLYAAGFLYGLVNDLSLDRCGKLGALVAGNVIEVMGARMDDDRWQSIVQKVKDIA